MYIYVYIFMYILAAHMQALYPQIDPNKTLGQP
jgi:hypothetical protein